MWVLNQEQKTAIKVDRLSIRKGSYGNEWIITSHGKVLGVYPTEEKATLVLEAFLEAIENNQKIFKMF